MHILAESERAWLIEALRKVDVENVGLDPRCEESDAHLIFEALHVLADGIAERLFDMLHPCGQNRHSAANPGRTMLAFHLVYAQGSSAAIDRLGSVQDAGKAA